MAFMRTSYIYSYRHVHTDTHRVHDMYICMHLLSTQKTMYAFINMCLFVYVCININY